MSTQDNKQIPEDERTKVALSYLALGWSIFPVNLKKKPLVSWKKYQVKITSKAEIKEWIGKFPDCGWGVATGRLSDLAVIDFETLKAITEFKEKVCDLPETIISITGRTNGEGRHYLFHYPHNFNLRNSAHKLKDTDFRGEGGYVIIPPSLHASGRRYQWDKINSTEHGLDDLCEMPPEAIKFFRGHGEQSKTTKTKMRS